MFCDEGKLFLVVSVILWFFDVWKRKFFWSVALFHLAMLLRYIIYTCFVATIFITGHLGLSIKLAKKTLRHLFPQFLPLFRPLRFINLLHYPDQWKWYKFHVRTSFIEELATKQNFFSAISFALTRSQNLIKEKLFSLFLWWSLKIYIRSKLLWESRRKKRKKS